MAEGDIVISTVNDSNGSEITVKPTKEWRPIAANGGVEWQCRPWLRACCRASSASSGLRASGEKDVSQSMLSLLFRRRCFCMSNLGFGRIVTSEMEAPILLHVVNLV